MVSKKNIFFALAFLFSSASCTKLYVSESLPNTTEIDPFSINTEIARLNISVDEEEWNIIYKNPTRKILIDAQVDFYDALGDVIFLNEPGTVEIKGKGSAFSDMKPLGIILNQPYDNSSGNLINPPTVLDGDNLAAIENFRLRNSGQDYGQTMLKDLVYTDFAIVNNLDLELKYGEPAQVFVNQDYYGLLNFRTETDVIALSNLLGVDKSSITYMKVDVKNGNIEFKSGDAFLGQALRDAINTKDTEALKRLIDLNNFIDYIIFEDYIGNDDWPENNVAAYSVNGSPFRFLLYDLDFAAFRTKNPRLPELEYLTEDLAKIYQALFNTDEEFTADLDRRQKELYAQFSVQQFYDIVDERAESIEKEIPYLISKRQKPDNILQWQLNLDRLKRDFEQTDKNNRKFYKLP